MEPGNNTQPQPEEKNTVLESKEDDIDRSDVTVNVTEDVEENTGESRSEAAEKPTQMILDNPKKSSKKKSVVIVLVAVILLAVASGLAYYLFVNKPTLPKQNQTSNLQSSKNNTASPTPQLTASDLVEQISKAVSSSYQVATNGSAPIPSGQIGVNKGTGSPSKNINGLYFIASEDGMSLSVVTAQGDTNTATTVSGFVKRQLQDKQLKQTGDAAFLVGQGAVLYESSSIVCTLTESSDQTSYMTLSCADLASYDKSAKDMQPLIDAYVAAGNEIGKYVLFDNLSIKQSGTSGYSSGTLGLDNTHGAGGFVGYFYEKNQTWHYWLGTQNTISCAKFDENADVKAAYKGEECVMPDGQLNTVQ